MKINIILSLLATCVFLSTSPSFSMDIDEKPTLCSTKTPSLETQLKNVVSFIEQRNAAGLPSKIVFGANNTEVERFPDEAVIFFDITGHNPEGRPYIEASFNDKEQLSIIARAIGPSLSEILVDRGTFKASEWNTQQHLAYFASMLRSDGEFVSPVHFDKQFNMTVFDYSATPDTILRALPKLNPYENEVPRIIKVPFILALSNESLHRNDVKEVYEKLESYCKLSEDEFLDKQAELGLFIGSDMEGEDLRQAIASHIILSEAKRTFENEVTLPYVQSAFAQHFKNVEYKENAQGFNVERLLITAKNPRR